MPQSRLIPPQLRATLTRLLHSPFQIAIGVGTGLVGLIVSFAGRPLALGRALADPLPLALSLGQLLRSLLYFNWRSLLLHLLFMALLALLTVLLLRWAVPNRGRFLRAVTPAVRIAAGINLGVVALLEIDALVVAFWYGIASLLSIVLTTAVANALARRLSPSPVPTDMDT